MKALVYHGPGNKDWESKSDPEIVEAYDVFSDAANTNAMKVVLSAL